MNLYRRFVLPRLLHFGCGLEPIREQRRQLVPRAEGRILEIGAGTGLNLPYYDSSRVERLFALEPAREMWRLAEPLVDEQQYGVEYLHSSAEAIPLETRSVDTVLVSYSLCTIPDVERALREMRRVLRTDGRLLFCEHGLAPEPRTQRWQARINPVWTRLAGGCNLNRNIPELIRQAGFAIKQMDNFYIPGPKSMTYHYRGMAD